MLLHPTQSQLDHLGLAGSALGLAGGERQPRAKAFKELVDNPEAKTFDPKLQWGPNGSASCSIVRRPNARRNAHTKLRYGQACVENIDCKKERGLDRRLIADLVDGHWLREHHNLLLVGACGCGKTWLSCAFGQKAARLEVSVLYHRLPKLFADLALARGDGRYPRLFRSLCRAQLLILPNTVGITGAPNL